VTDKTATSAKTGTGTVAQAPDLPVAQAPGRIAAKARYLRRRFLRGLGKHAGDLDPLTAEALRAWSLARAATDVLAERGEAESLSGALNTERRLLTELAARVEPKPEADPERALADAIAELGDEAEDEDEADEEDEEPRPAEAEPEAELPTPPALKNAGQDRSDERGAPSSGPDNPGEGEGGYPLQIDRNTATLIREKVVTLAHRLDPRRLDLPELPLPSLPEPHPRETVWTSGPVMYVHRASPPTKRSDRLTETAFKLARMARGTPAGVAGLIALLARRSGEIDPDGDGDARALGVPDRWHGPEVEPAPPGEPLRRGQPMPMPREYRGAGRTAVPWAIW
jgi:hypothetical protein